MSRGARWRNDLTMAALIGCGSALGGLSRVLVAMAMPQAPLIATGLVNVSGALLIGLIHVVTLPGSPWAAPVALRQMILAGFLGGFTTFSILSLETLLLLQAQAFAAAAANMLLSLVLALLAVALGVGLGRRLLEARRA